jgi:hypothetical protein
MAWPMVAAYEHHYINRSRLRRWGLDILPALRWDEAGKVADIRRRNDDRVALLREEQGLGGQDHIAVECEIGRSWLSLLASLRPEVGRLQHRRRGNGHILQRRLGPVEMGNAAEPTRTEQFAPDLIIGNLRDRHTHAAGEQRPKPLPAPLVLGGRARIGDHPERTRI